MNSRERMLAAFDRKPVDRIPTDIWATQEVWDKLRAHFGEGADLLAELHIDGLPGVDAAYIGPRLPEVGPGESVDFWGMRRKRIAHTGGAYDEQTFYPLAAAETIADLDDYAWPTTAWFDYSKMKAQARAARETRAVSCGYMAPFYFHNLLRGLEQSLMDPLVQPEFTHEVIRRISDFFYDHHRQMFEACDGLVDVAQVTDDLGSQTGPLLGMDTYLEFYAPQHKRFIDLCHKFGVRVFHHDDGSCRPFLPVLVEMGIDILNPIQWTCPGMDMRELKNTPVWNSGGGPSSSTRMH
ncbi:MAG: hypothetical protein HZB26_07745 [Candidatus Hydrogenedentes bacterium]|nr:hypothetical protein [Candidatus Hydrogenedentota bacterium]